jgi:hypothetical protein
MEQKTAFIVVFLFGGYFLLEKTSSLLGARFSRACPRWKGEILAEAISGAEVDI